MTPSMWHSEKDKAIGIEIKSVVTGAWLEGGVDYEGTHRTFWGDGNIFIEVVVTQLYTFVKAVPSKCEFHCIKILPNVIHFKKRGEEKKLDRE